MSEQKLNSFSIIIPTCGRFLVKRAIKSVQEQIYDGNIEIVIVDDARMGSKKEEFGKMLDNIAVQDSRIKIIHHPKETQRVVATNDGMKSSTKDWLTFLDDDDCYLRTYLYSINRAINQFPDYSIFHFGALVCRADRYEIRPTFDIKEEDVGMQTFRSGKIGMGSFVFKKELLDDIGYLPEGKDLTPYSFADVVKEKFPELREFYGPTYLEGGKELGNPWGQDYLLFWMLTRKHKSKGIPIVPYINYIRRSGFHFQDDNLDV